ncbi:MAG: polysaccharide biosynthesis C-terminal domain-containing protein [Candidatus Eisenbacteria bacterium]|nr:polysaccharide biosynthesis C-terminal domain-containing protein [Candidatus Eisenbacteria bacterium]
MASNSLASMAGRVGSMAFWVLATPYILHRLGPERFGLWSLLFVLTTYMVIMDLGVGTALSRFSADSSARGSTSDLGRYISSSNSIYLGLSAVFLAAASLLADPILLALRVPVTIPEARTALALGAVTAVVVGFGSLVAGVMNGLQRQVTVNAISLAALVPGGLGIWLALRQGAGLSGLLAVQAGVAALAGLGTAIFLYRGTPGLRVQGFGWDPGAVRRLLGLGMWIQLAGVATVLQLQLDKFFLTRWAGLPVVGAYELGFRVAGGLFALPILAFGAVAPAAADFAARGDRVRLRDLHVRGVRWVAALALPLLAGTWFGGGWLMRGWLDQVPGGAVPTLQLLSLAWALNALTGTGTAILQGEGRPQLTFACMSGALAVHVALALVWVPRWGLSGALAAILVSMLVWVGAFVPLFHRRCGWSSWDCVVRPLARPVVVSAIAAAGLWAVQRGLPEPAITGRWTSLGVGLILVVAPVAVCLPVLAAIRHFEPADLAVVRELARRCTAPRRSERP